MMTAWHTPTHVSSVPKSETKQMIDCTWPPRRPGEPHWTTMMLLPELGGVLSAQAPHQARGHRDRSSTRPRRVRRFLTHLRRRGQRVHSRHRHVGVRPRPTAANRLAPPRPRQPELRSQALVELRSKGGDAQAAADLITRTFANSGGGVPVYVEQATFEGQRSVHRRGGDRPEEREAAQTSGSGCSIPTERSCTPAVR